MSYLKKTVPPSPKKYELCSSKSNINGKVEIIASYNKIFTKDSCNFGEFSIRYAPLERKMISMGGTCDLRKHVGGTLREEGALLSVL